MYATETKKDKKISFQGTTQIELEITETTCFSLENQTNELEIKSLFNAISNLQNQLSETSRTMEVMKTTTCNIQTQLSETNKTTTNIQNKLVNFREETRKNQSEIERMLFLKKIECNFQNDGTNECFFHGIFNYFRNLSGGNPYDNATIKLIASSSDHSSVGIILEPNSNDWFGTKDLANSCIIIDFQKQKVSLTGYTLQTHNFLRNGHIVGWCLYGSNDCRTWNLIDNVSNCLYFQQHLGGIKYFPLASKTIYYQYFKIEQTSANSMGYYNLRLSRIEFFGTINKE